MVKYKSKTRQNYRKKSKGKGKRRRKSMKKKTGGSACNGTTESDIIYFKRHKRTEDKPENEIGCLCLNGIQVGDVRKIIELGNPKKYIYLYLHDYNSVGESNLLGFNLTQQKAKADEEIQFLKLLNPMNGTESDYSLVVIPESSVHKVIDHTIEQTLQATIELTDNSGTKIERTNNAKIIIECKEFTPNPKFPKKKPKTHGEFSRITGDHSKDICVNHGLVGTIPLDELPPELYYRDEKISKFFDIFDEPRTGKHLVGSNEVDEYSFIPIFKKDFS